jgi:hypothetical protein
LLGYAVRLLVPLVMVPDSKQRWAYPTDPSFRPIDASFPRESSTTTDLPRLVRRYLSAFGPATVADAQAWSGVRGLAPVFLSMRDELVEQTGPGRAPYFDVPDAPRPHEDVEAPVRLLAEFDDALLAYKDRSRIVDPAHKAAVYAAGLRVLSTFTVDGFCAGTWSIARKKGDATITLSPLVRLDRKSRASVEAEAEALLRFVEDDAKTFAVEVARG